MGACGLVRCGVFSRSIALLSDDGIEYKMPGTTNESNNVNVSFTETSLPFSYFTCFNGRTLHTTLLSTPSIKSLQGLPHMSADLTPKQKEDVEKINNAIEYCICTGESSLIYLVATSKNHEQNSIKKIPSAGKVVGKLVYDNVNDSYNIIAYEVFKVGTIPISYAMRMKDNPHWHTYVPIPKEVIEEHLSSKQQFLVKRFKKNIEDILGDMSDFYYVGFTGYF